MNMPSLPVAQNALLAGLPSEEWETLQPHLQNVALLPQTTLHDYDAAIQHAYFPLGGVVSLLVEFSDGFSAEVAQIGREGMVGISLVLGQMTSRTSARVQVPGTTLRVAADVLIEQLAKLPSLRRRLLDYAGVEAAQSWQFAACNAHHNLDARLARCLLGVRDRCSCNKVSLTHQNFATLLCAHRPSVSISMKRLEASGIICQGSPGLTILDHHGLKQASCECYAVMRDLRSTDR